MKKLIVLLVVCCLSSSFLSVAADASSLYQASESGKVKDVNDFITKGADVNAKTSSKQTSLHVACRNGNKEIVEILIKNGADVNVSDNLGSTPLHVAKSGEIAEILIKNGASLEQKDKNGATPLWDAAWTKRPPVVEVLLAHGANPHVTGPFNQTVLHTACRHNTTQELDALAIVILLFGKNVQVNVQDDAGNTPLHNAAASGCDKVLDYLLMKDADFFIKNNAKKLPLHEAAYFGPVKCVELLFYKVPAGDLRIVAIDSKDERGNTPLHYATLNLNEEIVVFLLEQGATFTKANNAGQLPESLIVMREDREPAREARVREIYTKHKEKMNANNKKKKRRFERIRALKKKFVPNLVKKG